MEGDVLDPFAKSSVTPKTPPKLKPHQQRFLSQSRDGIAQVRPPRTSPLDLNLEPIMKGNEFLKSPPAAKVITMSSKNKAAEAKLSKKRCHEKSTSPHGGNVNQLKKNKKNAIHTDIEMLSDSESALSDEEDEANPPPLVSPISVQAQIHVSQAIENAINPLASAKIPPIILRDIKDFPKVAHAIKSTCKGTFSFKSKGTSNCLQTSTAEDHRAATKALSELGIQYQTHRFGDKTSIKLLIKGLDPTCPIELIKEELELLGIEVESVSRLTSFLKGRRPLPYFQVNVEKDSQSSAKLQNLTYLYYTSITVEPYRNPKGPQQCYRCLGFNHMSSTCNNQYNCVKCGQPHDTRVCKKEYETPTNCYNCAKYNLSPRAHTANFKGCPVYLYLKAQKLGQKPARPVALLSKTNIQDSTQQRQNQVNFIPAPPPPTSAWGANFGPYYYDPNFNNQFPQLGPPRTNDHAIIPPTVQQSAILPHSANHEDTIASDTPQLELEQISLDLDKDEAGTTQPLLPSNTENAAGKAPLTTKSKNQRNPNTTAHTKQSMPIPKPKQSTSQFRDANTLPPINSPNQASFGPRTQREQAEFTLSEDLIQNSNPQTVFQGANFLKNKINIWVQQLLHAIDKAPRELILQTVMQHFGVLMNLVTTFTIQSLSQSQPPLYNQNGNL